jgi:hypothetical protein
LECVGAKLSAHYSGDALPAVNVEANASASASSLPEAAAASSSFHRELHYTAHWSVTKGIQLTCLEICPFALSAGLETAVAIAETKSVNAPNATGDAIPEAASTADGQPDRKLASSSPAVTSVSTLPAVASSSSSADLDESMLMIELHNTAPLSFRVFCTINDGLGFAVTREVFMEKTCSKRYHLWFCAFPPSFLC